MGGEGLGCRPDATLRGTEVIPLLIADECSSANCLDDGGGASGLLPNRWTMPLLRLGEKRFYLGIFFKVRRGLAPVILS